jgi:hypothetical protein
LPLWKEKEDADKENLEDDQYIEGITMEELNLPLREDRNRESLGLEKLNT